MFFSSVLANVTVDYMLIMIDLLYFIVDDAVLSVLYKMSFFTDF